MEELVYEAIKTFLWFTIPIIVLGIICIAIRFLTKIPDFIFRKILHLIAVSMITVLLIVPTHWWIAEIVMGIGAIGIVVLLLIFERTEIYKKFFVEKNKHEILISFLIFFLVVIYLIALFWGYRGEAHRYLVIIALLSWGLGDAAAAIFGRLIGKHIVSGKVIGGNKSIEGSVMCFVFALVISFLLLFLLMHYLWWLSLIEALLIALLVSFAELFTKKGLDNLTCPLVASVILLLFSLL